MERFFKLKENNTTVSTEIMAGLTTFFAMSYIIFVNPSILSAAGMPYNAVFLATIFAAFIGTLFMGLFANVPYALGPGMGLNAFFTNTVVLSLGFSWQEALAIVFICGILNVLITVTKIRKEIIRSIPESLQHAIGGGIGIFIAYTGIKNANLLHFISNPGNILSINGDGFTAGSALSYPQGVYEVVTGGGIVPELTNFADKAVILAVIGIIITIIFLVLKIKGAILISMILTTILGVLMGVVDTSNLDISFSAVENAFKDLNITLFAAFGKDGMGSLFSDSTRIPLVLTTIFSFSLADTFDTIGTFIGTGRQTGIFTEKDMKSLEESTGFKSKMDKAMFADSIATSIGAVLGTSNTTTYVESAAGIGAGGRTGLTSVVTAIAFLLCIFLAPITALVPTEATAPILIAVGIMMLSAFKKITWDDFSEAAPAFFAGAFMALSYNISYGIAFSFITYCIVKFCKKEAKDIHPILMVSTILFIINFVLLSWVAK